MNGPPMVIGVDHGFNYTKTSHSVTLSGLSLISGETISNDHILMYNEKKYQIGAERLKVQNDKVSYESFYLLTLPAIANEMKYKGLKEAKVILAVGLPIGRLSAEKKKFTY